MVRWARRLFRNALVTFVVLLSLGLAPALGQSLPTEVPQGNQVDGYAVELDGTVLFHVRQGVPGVVSAQERAVIINERLQAIANDPNIPPTAIQTEELGQESIVKAGDTVLFTVRNSDVVGLEVSRSQAAQDLSQKIQGTVVAYRKARTVRYLLVGAGLAIASTLGLLIVLKLLQLSAEKLRSWIQSVNTLGILGVQWQNLQLLNSHAIGYLLISLVQLMRLMLTLLAFYLYLPFVLRQFPFTRRVGDRLLQDVLSTLQKLVTGLAEYVPNLVLLVIIGYIAFFVIGLTRLIIHELGREAAYTWFYPEWVIPTIRLATILIIAIAMVIAAPYLPGFNSPSFQGISLFLGALLTLGSSSAVANAIAGIILIYTRAFRLGDVVRLQATLGSVVEKSLFVTRIQTFKGEIVTIPNTSVLGNEVTNLSFISRETDQDLVLYSTITLGYDLPWRQVHEVLIQAAIATPYILPEPPPFVLQTALNDYNVSYEINACTDRPDLIPQILTALHQNMQDYCNAAGIEILSPAFTALRDGNHSTIPLPYLAQDYRAPGFRIGE